jgi:hypothetical protein
LDSRKRIHEPSILSPLFIGGDNVISTADVSSGSSLALSIDSPAKKVRWMGRVEWSYAVELSDQEI